MSDPALSEPVHVLAHAKVNLYLAVGRLRDDGYHDVTTVMQAISVADDVVVRRGVPRDDLSCDPDLGVPSEKNLAWRAVEAFRTIVDDPAPVGVSVSKRIPVGGGLGGGSSDAAAVLVALDGARAQGASSSSLLSAAASLGADVPFFLGEGTQLLRGRGDEPAGVLPTPTLDIVLVRPPGAVLTAEAYATLDRLPRVDAPGPEAMIEAVRSGDPAAIAAKLHNDMSAAAVALVPGIGDALRCLEHSEGILGATVCGSGSAVFGICADRGVAVRLAREAAARGWWSTPASSVSRGVEPCVPVPEEEGPID